ncbi:hypothetical protein PVL29_004780 [Vitis rotundifolia]|uniref:Uncharacterized protein n=1 Tax=Vitis rotundifolia TaxID=103349 RepID=A0AA39E2X8_VITRO|nr:hypothetical protein PVL29_004780 [Vitis rotundifolia]
MAQHQGESHGDNFGTILSDLEEHGHGEIELGEKMIVPTAIVTGKSIVRWAKVGSGDKNGRAFRVAWLRVISALEFEASTATKSIVEKCCAQCNYVPVVPLAINVNGLDIGGIKMEQEHNLQKSESVMDPYSNRSRIE